MATVTLPPGARVNAALIKQILEACPQSFECCNCSICPGVCWEPLPDTIYATFDSITSPCTDDFGLGVLGSGSFELTRTCYPDTDITDGESLILPFECRCAWIYGDTDLSAYAVLYDSVTGAAQLKTGLKNATYIRTLTEADYHVDQYITLSFYFDCVNGKVIFKAVSTYICTDDTGTVCADNEALFGSAHFAYNPLGGSSVDYYDIMFDPDAHAPDNCDSPLSPGENTFDLIDCAFSSTGGASVTFTV